MTDNSSRTSATTLQVLAIGAGALVCSALLGVLATMLIALLATMP
jgi:hypothetical protein